jgi:hypothetical protein
MKILYRIFRYSKFIPMISFGLACCVSLELGGRQEVTTTR